MARYYKLQKISTLMLIIMLISGMCFDSFKTDSFSSSSSANSLQVIQEISPCTLTMEMIEMVTYRLAQHLTVRSTGARSNFCKLIDNVFYSNFLPVPNPGIYSEYFVHFACGSLPHRCIITYIHSSDGKKRI